MLVVGLVAAAFIDFPLISFNMSNEEHPPTFWIPVLFAVAMGLDAISAIVFDHFFDRIGMTAIARCSPVYDKKFLDLLGEEFVRNPMPLGESVVSGSGIISRPAQR